MMHNLDLTSCGEDKQMDLWLLKNRIRIEYAPEAVIREEKTQHSSTFVNQRKRWLYAQFKAACSLRTGIRELWKRDNFDLFNRNLQLLLLPKVMLLTGSLTGWVIALVSSDPAAICLWSSAVGSVLLAFLFSTPRKFYSLKTLKSALLIPYSFFLMISALIGINGASKRFIHTPHGARKAGNRYLWSGKLPWFNPHEDV